MDFLGIGPLEVLFVLIIALVIFGPKDIVKAGQAAGRFLRKLVTSAGWQTVQKTSKELRTLPNRLIREAGLEDVKQDMNQIASIAKPPDFKKELQESMDDVQEGLSAWTTIPSIKIPEPTEQSEETKPTTTTETD